MGKVNISIGYEEFIEGIKPITDENGNITYEVKNGVFKDFCEKAELPKDETINHNAEIYIVRLNVSSVCIFKEIQNTGNMATISYDKRLQKSW